MSVFQAVILGIVQGLTEFLPVSSSGHLIFFPKLFGWADQGMAFDVVLHLGTLVAVVVYFRKKLWNILKAIIVKPTESAEVIPGDRHESISLTLAMTDRKLGWFILLSIIPAVIVGFFWADWLENTFRSATVVAFNMIFWGLVLYIADRYTYRLTDLQTYKLEKLNWKQTLFIGCAQVLAFIPGTSRSGITMTAGLFSRLDRTSVAEFSFLMSVPIIALAGAKGLWDLVQSGSFGEDFLVLLVGFIFSALSGLLAVWGLLKIIKKYSFLPFVIYRIILGILILLFL